jgi:hypothetical protein
MTLNRLLVAASMGLFLCATANARRDTPQDTWGAPVEGPGQTYYNLNAPPLPMGPSLVFTSSTQLTSGSLPTWLETLTISPGQLSGSLIGGASAVQQEPTSLAAADMWAFTTANDTPDPDPNSNSSGQVVLIPTSSLLTIDLNYAATSCAGPASLSINGLGFTTSNPCAAGSDDPPATNKSDCNCDFQQSQFVFGLNSAGQVVLEDALPANWTEVGGGPVSAPEIDPRGILIELVFAAGCVAVLRGRRGRLTDIS